MAAIVEEDIEAPEFGDNGDAKTISPRRFMYKDLDYLTGENIREHALIPRLDEGFMFKGTFYWAVGIRTREFSPSSGEVLVDYSSKPRTRVRENDFKQWEYTYTKTDVIMPLFILEKYWYTTSNGTIVQKGKWVDRSHAIKFDFPVLSIVVNRNGGFSIDGLGNGNFDTNPVVGDINEIGRRLNQIHQFPRLGNKLWILAPPDIRSVAMNRYQIAYTWVADPGNGPHDFVLPEGPISDDPNTDIDESSLPTDAEVVCAPARPPWHKYVVWENRNPDVNLDIPPKPQVVLQNTVPPRDRAGRPNPKYVLDGWATLPGRPLGT